MNRILLLLDNKTNLALLSDWLGQHYEIIRPDQGTLFGEPFDVCLIDGPTLDRLGSAVQMRKTEESPAFLPVALITSHRKTELITRHLWQTVDDLIRVPIEKVELQARVEILLRTRRLSLDLQMRNEELESFFHAMTHDVRAPLRAITGFVEFLKEEEAERLSPQGWQDLTKIQAVTAQMQNTIEGLINFARIEHGDRQMQPVSLDLLVTRCVEHLGQEIQQRQAKVVICKPLPLVEGNVVLLMLALTNLVSNAIKFVPQEVIPVVTIRAAVTPPICRLEIEDKGIGIAPEDQQRLFQPFVQLHGVEVYEGVGLGLATARKAVELMGGRIGVTSSPGQGSTFWLELRSGE
jgi:signal transduction histidine kinase